jgi:hypothetical protein
VHPLAPVAAQLAAHAVRYLVIGISGANFYAPSGQAVFSTEDFDLFLPLDSDNLVRAWTACATAGLTLWSGVEPLDDPVDGWLADRIIEHRATTRAIGPGELFVDLTLTMQGFDFEAAWRDRRVFLIDGVDVPTARLRHIVESKLAAGRDKDRLFLATHRDALEQLLKGPDGD